MKMYITKYALSSGVVLMDGEEHAEGWFLPDGHTTWDDMRIGRDAHDAIEAAEARFNEMVTAKAKSLEAQLTKLRALKFEVKS